MRTIYIRFKYVKTQDFSADSYLFVWFAPPASIGAGISPIVEYAFMHGVWAIYNNYESLGFSANLLEVKSSEVAEEVLCSITMPDALPNGVSTLNYYANFSVVVRSSKHNNIPDGEIDYINFSSSLAGSVNLTPLAIIGGLGIVGVVAYYLWRKKR